MFRFFLSGRVSETDNKTNESEESLSSSSMFNDRVLIGGIAGALGFLTRDVYNFFAKLIGFAKFYVWQITANVFMDKKEVSTFFGNVVGILGDIAFGSAVGVFFVYFVKSTNTKNFLIKGWGVGLATWLLIYAILLRALPSSAASAPKDALSNISAFIGHSILGISMGVYAQILLKKYGLFEEDGVKCE